MDELVRIDKTLDELLVSLGRLVLRLANTEASRTVEERRALAQTVQHYSACAKRSADPRVQRMNDELLEALRPRLRLVASR